ncbi:MAG: CehA/McbA family metallohydrolase [Lachnospiraceae bacterium]|nr:CehA/McbA family metallohydrolase [Lachnospiraceae bacterium]
MRREMFAKSGNWYKGNLHSHTTNSDGRLKPEEAVKLYKSYGYHFMCLSEHDVYTDLREQFDSRDFILLPGVEASACLVSRERTGLVKTHHIHGILGNQAMQRAAGEKLFRHGEKLEPPVYQEEWNGLAVAQKLLDSLRERGCFTTYNHPAWSRVEIGEVADLKELWAVEIYNYGTVVECGEGYDSVFWEAMLRKGTHVCGFASDDNHNPGKFFDSLGGYVMVCSEELSHEAIVNHLLTGDYYFTAGPRISQWGIEENQVFVECSDVERINFIVGGTVGSSETVLRHVDPLNCGRHELKGGETYVRVECVDEKGRTAWTNPLWLQ